jgi:heme/copper-type cytochrome/quinol oxidase subunit 4
VASPGPPPTAGPGVNDARRLDSPQAKGAKRQILMSRILGLVLAVALTAGGALWLVFILALAEHVSNRLIAAACIVFAMGVYWLWIDYIHAPPGQDE